MTVNLKFLIAKLNETCRKATEAAAALCVSRTNYEVDLEHILVSLLEVPNCDVHRILAHFEVDAARLAKDLTAALDRLKRGNSRGPTLSPRVLKLLTDSWTIASIDRSEGQIRSGVMLSALMASDELARLVQDSSAEFLRINLITLRQNWDAIVAGSVEEARGAGGTAAAAPGPRPAGNSATPNLDQYTIDLTAAARAGHIDPVLGRDAEIRQVIDILTRRRQNNPILTGEAGVGKTAIVEGFALRIAAGDVHPSLRHVSLRTLDLGLLQAGAGIRGEFENRLKGVIQEVKASSQPVILFIDEAHQMIGAGGSAGQGDAANLLKPALARGELRTIAATTQAEYKKYFEKDAALARRFQVVKVDEPAEEQAIDMMRGLAPRLERHHGVRLLDEAVEAAVRLSHRYISGRQLPDKAVGVLDTACARVALSQTGLPPAVEDGRLRIAALERKIQPLEREAAAGAENGAALAALRAAKDAAQAEVSLIEVRWEREKGVVERVLSLRSTLENTPRAADAVVGGIAIYSSDWDRAADELRQAQGELQALQAGQPLVQWCVNAQVVAEVISAWTGIPVGRVVKAEIESILGLEEALGQRIIGQDQALEAIAKRIRTTRAGLDDPMRPTGVFLLVGPSGVGKTETALALADVLYGGDRNLVSINMSEYQEAHTVSGLKGSPPGYVGYGEGGILTEAVRRKPYSVVLLDEMEKAHPDVLELFYQVFDKGRMEDAEGREIDFRNTIILMTSNVGWERIFQLCSLPEGAPDAEALRAAVMLDLQKVFKPALLGRLTVVPYYPVGDATLRRIVGLKLGRIRRHLEESHRIEFVYSESLVRAVAARCTEGESGARNVDHVLTGTLLPEISTTLLGRMASGDPVTKVWVDILESGEFSYRVEPEAV